MAHKEKLFDNKYLRGVMAAQSPTEQTISTRCRRLRQLIDMYFRALEWVIHHDNGWQLGKAENRFCLNRQNLKALGINTVADINDDPDWTQSVENVMWDKKSVDETGLFYRSDLQLKADQGESERLPDNTVVTMITFKPYPNHIPIWEILETMKGAFCRIEKDIQITGVQWSRPPSFQHCECAQDLLNYVKAKNQQPEEILKNLETERKGYKQLANTVRRRSAQLSNETQKQTETGQGNHLVTKKKADDWGQVSIDIIDTETLRYKVGTECWKRVHFAEVGFMDKRKGLPNKLWPIFKEMAKNSGGGYIDIHTPENISKDVDRICNILKEFFGPSERPILYNKKAKRYVLKFSLSYKSDT